MKVMKDGVPEQKTRSQDAAISKPAKPKQTKKPKKTPKIRSKIKPDIVTVGTKGISFPMQDSLPKSELLPKRSSLQALPRSKSKDSAYSHKQSEGNEAKACTRTRSQDKVEVMLPLQYSKKYEGGTYSLKLHSTYQVTNTHPLFSSINALFELYLLKEQKRNRNLFEVCHYSYFPSFEFLLRQQKAGDYKCSICQFELQQCEDLQAELVTTSPEDAVILPCSHILHHQCLALLVEGKEWVKCPICSTIFGIMIGDQPVGSMTWTVHKDMHCEGYEDTGTIVVHYSMQAGKRGTVSFPGTGRTAYLPDNKEGNEVLLLLVEAFNRKLVFTVGRSVTTGRDNQIVWNGIHHKTNLSGGAAYFGYPDPTYFDRVKQELAAKGVTM